MQWFQGMAHEWLRYEVKEAFSWRRQWKKAGLCSTTSTRTASFSYAWGRTQHGLGAWKLSDQTTLTNFQHSNMHRLNIQDPELHTYTCLTENPAPPTRTDLRCSWLVRKAWRSIGTWEEHWILTRIYRHYFLWWLHSPREHSVTLPNTEFKCITSHLSPV